ncbi:MAG: 4-alpha-glucanotransferase [Myxococcales bacterium]|nr:4-alpha-glucanotransferase [Myxococcales bacterium]
MLRKLAESYGVSTSHIDGLGQEVQASDEAMLAVLRAFGLDIESVSQAERLLEQRLSEEPLLAPPCLAGGAGELVVLPLHGQADMSYHVELTLESGSTLSHEGLLGELPENNLAYQLALGSLESGYHQAVTLCGEARATTYLLIAPKERFGAPGSARRLGLFAPLYAIRGENDFGVGDFSDLGRLMEWAGEQGVDFVGTLPLSASNYREESQNSPYSPVSRLYWNEVYLDVAKLAARFPSEHLAELQGHPRFIAERDRLAELELIDYKKTSETKSRLLYRIAETAWDQMSEVFEALLEAHPDLHSYAEFRAIMEATGTTYHQWPDPQRLGDLGDASYDDDDYRYHVFVQWAAGEQLAELGKASSELYLDLSVGAGGSSYDVWRHRETFVSGVDLGAPPDALFEDGQNWALPPLHPELSRRNGHAYFTECVRANMRHAGMLRVDHLMGLHRLYWVPSELSAAEGLYVQYPAAELYAILRIEAERNQCILVGEDLGTVPASVRPAMENAGMYGLYVGQFSVESSDESQPTLLPASAQSFASFNTHDTPTFAGWFDSTDLRCEPTHLMKQWTESLASGPAAAVVVTLEDTWLESRPQNKPGTGQEEPNWRRRFQYTLAEIVEGEEPAAWLRHLQSLRSS